MTKRTHQDPDYPNDRTEVDELLGPVPERPSTKPDCGPALNKGAKAGLYMIFASLAIALYSLIGGKR